MNVLKVMLVFVAMFTLACSQKPHDASQQAKTFQGVEKVKITDALEGSHFKDIYFSRQPAMSDFDTLKEQGFTHVINLRRSAEYDEQAEKDKLAALGIQYTNVPFGPEDELTDQYIGQVTQAVMAHRAEGKTLVHCSSSNRVGLWVGGHFYKDHHVTKTQARELAAVAGMNKAPIEAKLDAYLATKP